MVALSKPMYCALVLGGAATISAGPLVAALGAVIGGVSAGAGPLVGGIGIAAAAGGGIAKFAGEVANHHSKRDGGIDPKTIAKQNKLAIQQCHSDLGKARVEFSNPSPGTLVTKGVPATCMTLATVFTGKFNNGNPVPLGTDSIQFTHVDEKTMKDIEDALNARHK